MIFGFAIQFVNLLVYALTTAIFLRAIFSWFVQPGSDNPIMRILMDVTEPIIAPLRRVLPQMGMLDLSPFVAMILIQVVGGLITQVLTRAAFSSGGI